MNAHQEARLCEQDLRFTGFALASHSLANKIAEAMRDANALQEAIRNRPVDR